MERGDPLTVPTVCVVLAAAVAGLLFAPVFGVAPLLVPVGVPAAAVLVTALACRRRPWHERRPLLTLPAGLLVVVPTMLWSTTVAGLPTGRTLDALTAGVTDSWSAALQSTWPARPVAALLLFVPLLVIVAAVLGVEVLHGRGGAPAALLPSLAVVVLAQLYAALPPGAAVVAALGYSAVAATLLATAGASGTRTPDGGTGGGRAPDGRAGDGRARAGGGAVARLGRLLPVVAAAVLCAVLGGVLAPGPPARYSLREHRGAPRVDTPLTNPLDEIAYRLDNPEPAVFRVSGAEADRWTLLVLDEFDGVTWRPGEPYRRRGAELRPDAAVTARVRKRVTRVDVRDAGGPWLPSQTWPAGVTGVEPLVAQRHGTLMLPGSPPAVRYTLDWWQLQVGVGALTDAAVDPALGGLGGVQAAPDAVVELAREAVGGAPPSFRTALLLQDHLRANYRPPEPGRALPAGHGWPQLSTFLLTDRQGTSEQFAAAYVALARLRGIPARLAVGYRTPVRPDPDGWYTVRNGDVLAWPEVAVRGVGWVPLDPGGTTRAAGPRPGGGLAAAAEQAAGELPAPPAGGPPAGSPPAGGAVPGDVGRGVTRAWLVLVALTPVACWPLAVRSAWTVRAWRRRRRPGPGAVVGAWQEARDRLRAYGAPVSAVTTTRDLAAAAQAVADPATVAQVRALGVAADQALWSGTATDRARPDEAWAAVRAVRRGLARRGFGARLRASLDVRALRPPR